MKAFRFSLPPGEPYEDDDNEEEEDGRMDHGAEEAMEHPSSLPQGPDSRSGSQLNLASTPAKSRKRDFLCGLCCSKRPAVSVWNCDGELLPHTEISCR